MKYSQLTSEQQKKVRNKYKDYVNNRRARGFDDFKDFDAWYYHHLNQGRQPWITTKQRNKNYNSRLRFHRQRAQARFRDIDFRFTWAAWHQWWLDHGVDRNVLNPERGRDRLCMCRFGDEGAYESSNVYLATHSENASDAAKNGRHRGGRPQSAQNKSKG